MDSTGLSPKMTAVYQAVIELFTEGADLNNLTVAEITAKAGIGKGTAYEYISNKEEMIAGALFHEMKNTCQSLCRRFEQEKDLCAKVDFILMDMEEHFANTNCFFRALHVLMDHSAISAKLREMVRTKREDEILIMDMIRMLLDKEMEDVKGLTGEDKEYLMMMVLSKIICFALYQFGAKHELHLESGAMRALICRNISREVESFRTGMIGV